VPGDECRCTARCTGYSCACLPCGDDDCMLFLTFNGCNLIRASRRTVVSGARCQAAACVAGGRSQPFYNVLVDVRQRPGSSTYVAQVQFCIPPLVFLCCVSLGSIIPDQDLPEPGGDTWS
jgi:hypothetical protein